MASQRPWRLQDEKKQGKVTAKPRQPLRDVSVGRVYVTLGRHGKSKGFRSSPVDENDLKTTS